MRGEFSRHPARAGLRRVALAGNPNSGKTTLFNALTGLRQKVGNYPGVTVEKKEGRVNAPEGDNLLLLDLPGLYSLTPYSPDEEIAADILVRSTDHTPPPDAVLCVVDATNLERSLPLAGEILDLGYPTVIALNMVDLAPNRGVTIDAALLSEYLGAPVVPTVASKGAGLAELRRLLLSVESPGVMTRLPLPASADRECEALANDLGTRYGYPRSKARHEAMVLLACPRKGNSGLDSALLERVERSREKLKFLGFDPERMFVEARFEWARALCASCLRRENTGPATFSDRIDHVLTHRLWGALVFFTLMALMFQAIFTWAAIPMGWIVDGFKRLGDLLTYSIPPGDLRNLMIDGALGGVSAVVSFLPQVLLMFLFIGLLEDTGYMARAAFIMNRMMGRFGLHGKSFIPLLSSFACAIPGIMATRTIENPRDRLATMLVAPLMSCSARLPVYTLMIAAFVPNTLLLGVISLPGVTLLSLYLLGVVAALLVAWGLKRTLLKGAPPVFIMELPAYTLPSVRSIILQMWDRAWSFMRKAGTLILGASIVLWFLATYPKAEGRAPHDQLEHSYVGMFGRLIEPAIIPLGFDWKIGVGLVTSLFQREMFVSTMGTLYSIDTPGSEPLSLSDRIRQGSTLPGAKTTFTTLTALCVMVYYVLAMQCLSTVFIMRRETNGWKWPMFQVAYMSALAYAVTFVVYRAGIFLGAGG